jgi:hypothetical protein
MKRIFLILAVLFSMGFGLSNCASTDRSADEMGEDAGDEMEEVAETP